MCKFFNDILEKDLFSLTKFSIHIIFRRTTEMLMGSILLSVLVCLMCITGVLPIDSARRDVALIIVPVIYIILNIRMLRKAYWDLGNRGAYYIINLCAHALFALVSLSTLAFCPRETYSWLFIVTGFMRFSRIGISACISITLFHILAVSSIFLAPLGMNWIFEAQKEAEEFGETLPPKLKINTSEIPANKKESVDEEENKKKTQNTV